jgi:signal transduction histidine kinase/CheY-like chemotaxis protein/integral membrane sensor domain MASE1/HPt (histidine-containing phosphotransfer) domain-containing protein
MKISEIKGPQSLLLQLLKVFGVAVAYFIAGRLALLLAIPPGFATAVWPAAGIAVAGVLLFGIPACIGVFIGSLSVNFCTALLAHGTRAFAHDLSIDATLALGVTVQAMAGAVLIRRFVGFPTPLIDDRDILKLMVLGGPVACLIASTFAIFTLGAARIVPREDLLFNWFTWWVGDSIGVLIFLPLILVWIEKPVAWRSRRFSIGVPLMANFAIVVLIFVASSRWEQNKNRMEFEGKARDIVKGLDHYLSDSARNVHSLAGLIASLPAIDDTRFQAVASVVMKHQRGLEALSLVTRVKDEDRALFEHVVSQEAGFDVKIKSVDSRGKVSVSPRHPVYYAVRLTFPSGNSSNSRALGFDAASRPGELGVIEASITDAKTVATPGFQLITRPETSGNGFVIFSPIYKRNTLHTSASEREQNLLGLAVAVLSWDKITDEAIDERLRAGINLQISEKTPSGAVSVLYPAGPDLTPTDPGTFPYEATIHVMNRQWALGTGWNAAYLSSHRSLQSWSVLAGGLLFNSMLGGFLLVITGRAAQVEIVVARRTEELRLTNESLAREQQTTKEILKQLSIAKEAAEVADRAKSAFLANMSHEIRTPMTSVLGYAKLLQADDLSKEDLHEFLRSLHRNAEHLLEIVSDVLDMSKIESGEMTVERVEMSPRDIVDEVTSLMKSQAAEKGLDFILHCDPSTPDRMSSDPTRVRQILLNLISNAIKFTDKGRVSVEVSTVCLQDRPHVRFEVADTGIGLTAEQQSRVFQPFVQAETSTTRRYGGTGLGLSICSRFIGMLGGTLSVESRRGHGSKFGFALPCEQADTLNHPAAESPELDVVKGERQASNLSFRFEHPRADRASVRILLAEDSADIRRLLATELKSTGIQLDFADNGQLAVEKVMACRASGMPYDLVLMDMRMPVLDGESATRRLREEGFLDLPIVVLTASETRDFRRPRVSYGCDEFVTKPINMEQLKGAIARQLNKRRAVISELEADDQMPIRSSSASSAGMAAVIAEYVRELPLAVLEMRGQLASGDLAELRESLHRLKGSGGMHGFGVLSTLAGEAEAVLVMGAERGAINNALQKLIAAMRRVAGYEISRESTGLDFDAAAA